MPRHFPLPGRAQFCLMRFALVMAGMLIFAFRGAAVFRRTIRRVKFDNVAAIMGSPVRVRRRVWAVRNVGSCPPASSVFQHQETETVSPTVRCVERSIVLAKAVDITLPGGRIPEWGYFAAA